MRPRVASLLLRRMGGVWTPVTRQPVLSTLCWSTNSTTATEEMVKEAQRRVESCYSRMKWGKDRVGGWGVAGKCVLQYGGEEGGEKKKKKTPNVQK